MKLIEEIEDWEVACVSTSASVADVIRAIDSVGTQLIMVRDEKSQLHGIVSNGDLRRAALKTVSIKENVRQIMNTEPLVAKNNQSKAEIHSLLISKGVGQCPIINEDGTLIGLYSLGHVKQLDVITNPMLIMAGGKGSRLYPLTKEIPKPLLMLHGKPILEHIIIKAKAQGFRKFLISINYLGYKIQEFFKDGSEWGVEIKYIVEDKPLGTIGGLGLLELKPTESFIVTNGDIIGDINYREILNFHLKKSAYLTMCVKKHVLQNPFGVVEIEGAQIVGFEEKPIFESYINAGVYVLSPQAANNIGKNMFVNTPDLFSNKNAEGMFMAAYTISGNWLDIGTPADWHKAQEIYND
jgi:dTDP-glucose pyrophosphorylase/CBS domain-containing protein